MACVAMRVSVSPSMLGGGSLAWVSAPEQNPRPSPVRITQVVSWSSATSARASCSGTISSKAIEFMRSGRARVITAVCGRGRSMRTSSSEVMGTTVAHVGRAGERLPSRHSTGATGSSHV